MPVSCELCGRKFSRQMAQDIEGMILCPNCFADYPKLKKEAHKRRHDEGGESREEGRRDRSASRDRGKAEPKKKPRGRSKVPAWAEGDPDVSRLLRTSNWVALLLRIAGIWMACQGIVAVGVAGVAGLSLGVASEGGWWAAVFFPLLMAAATFAYFLFGVCLWYAGNWVKHLSAVLGRNVLANERVAWQRSRTPAPPAQDGEAAENAPAGQCPPHD